MAKEQVNEIEAKGKFIESLMRNNAKIRQDRALSIYESAQMLYKRTIEDTEIKVKQLHRERESLLDLSPESATSLVLKADFDEKAFVEKDIALGLQIRNNEIILDVAKARYSTLFEA